MTTLVSARSNFTQKRMLVIFRAEAGDALRLGPAIKKRFIQECAAVSFVLIKTVKLKPWQKIGNLTVDRRTTGGGASYGLWLYLCSGFGELKENGNGLDRQIN